MTTPPLHEQIRARRLELGLTQEQAAARVSPARMSRHYWANIEGGNVRASPKRLAAMAAVLGCRVVVETRLIKTPDNQ